MDYPTLLDPSLIEEAFGKHLGLFAHPKGAHLTQRTRPLGDWLDLRTDLNTWPYARTLQGRPGTETRLESQNGRRVSGINFGSQDYLGLASHPDILRAAMAALEEFGPHTAASPMLQGNTTLGREVERALADMLQMENVLLFPTGWAAGFGTITGLVRPTDYILVDQLAHASLIQGVRAATPNYYLFRHNDVEAVRHRLQKIRAKDTENAILVVSEGLFSMDSDSPDIALLQAACREFGAVLMVDVAHDFGASGPGGTGQIGLQDMLGQVDLVMGSFSKTFASNGGFLATHDRSVRQYLGIYGGSHMYSNGFSPVQAGVVLEALRIVRSPEGTDLRERAFDNILRMRAGFEVRGVECLGDPSNVVPVMAGDDAVGKWTGRLLEENGLIANLVEFPAVPRGKARFRFQVMASHTPEQIDRAVDVFCRCLEEAKRMIN
ncbi:MAG TPA: aminotransferase class I/II-fold pyridoxal phosphate-dependent enzyme [Thermoanaerobaculia bacterium]|nr:aminotransferase class I/II-fold pyridoxal phosphate-dependent enzyme [Thermoanaerobaculia bacterium]